MRKEKASHREKIQPMRGVGDRPITGYLSIKQYHPAVQISTRGWDESNDLPIINKDFVSP
jgi:hypothetical protein